MARTNVDMQPSGTFGMGAGPGMGGPPLGASMAAVAKIPGMANPAVLRAKPYRKPGVDEDAFWDRAIDAAEAQATRDQRAWDKFVKLFKEGQFQLDRESKTESGVSANQTFAYVQMLMALLLAQAPDIQVEPRENATVGDGAFAPVVQQFGTIENCRREFADAVEETLRYTYETTRSNRHNEAVLFEAIVRGLGYSKESFDLERNIDRCDCLRRDEVFVDPHARYDMTQAKYVIQTVILPIEDAQAFFQAKGVDTSQIEANWTLGAGKGLEADYAKKNSPDVGKEDMFKFYEIWCKHGQERHLYYKEWKSKEWLLKSYEWPFVMEADDFPFTPLCFAQQYTQVNDAFPELYVVEGLREAYETVIEFLNRHTKRAAAKKVLYDKSAIDPDDVAKLLNPRDMEFVGLAAAGRSLSDVVKLLDFNSATDATVNDAAAMKKIRDEVLGQDELLRGAETNDMTAREAEIRDEFAKLRIGKKQKALDDFFAQQLKHRACIARQLVTPDIVNDICGPEHAMLWGLHAGDAVDLLSEYSVTVGAGSTGVRARADKMGRFQRFLQLAIQINQLKQAPVYDLVEISMEILRQDEVRRPQKYLTPPPPPQPMLPQQQMPGAGAPMANGPGPGVGGQIGSPPLQPPALGPALHQRQGLGVRG